jgi:AcrR family transcriptional regulator
MSYSEKQAHILDVAEKLFATRGYDGTSVRDIAEEADVNVSMISYYFGSKEKLMEALFFQRTHDVYPRYEQVLADETLSAFEKLSLIIDDYVERAADKIRIHKIMLTAQLMEKSPAISEWLAGIRKRNMELLQRLLELGVQKGDFKRTVDPVLMGSTLFGTVFQSFLNQETYKTVHGLEHLSNEEFNSVFRENLSRYIKDLFKSLLSYEA